MYGCDLKCSAQNTYNLPSSSPLFVFPHHTNYQNRTKKRKRNLTETLKPGQSGEGVVRDGMIEEGGARGKEGRMEGRMEGKMEGGRGKNRTFTKG